VSWRTSEHGGAGVPWTPQRATRFHELILAGARPLARRPIVPVPAGFRLQPSTRPTSRSGWPSWWRLVEIRMPGTASARAGGMLPGPGAVTGGRSWARFVAEHHGAPARD
jgi:hypothetical protein